MEKKLSTLTLLTATLTAVYAQDAIDISAFDDEPTPVEETVQIEFPADIFSTPATPSEQAVVINTASVSSSGTTKPTYRPANPTFIPKPATKPKPKKPAYQPTVKAEPATAIITDDPFVETAPADDFDVPTAKPALSLSGMASDIAELTGRSRINWQGVNNRIHSRSAVLSLYDAFNYQPLWTESGVVTPLAAKVIKETLKASDHALRPETYHSDATSSIKAGTTVAEPAKFDVILTDAFITYKSHLANGIVDPKSQFKLWNSAPQKLNFVKLYNKAKNSGKVSSILRIHDKDYLALQKAYLAEINKPAGKSYDKVPAKRTLRVGSRGKSVILLRARLDLPTDSDVYDKTVKAAVRDYQKQNGLGADGIAGKRTLRHMNGTGTNHIEKLAINMERYRWGKKPNRSYVWVNIPAYKMAVKKGNKSLFKSNVIVGRPERSTPVFRDTMEHVVLAPYWNVPKTIFTEDKLPKLQKNANALSKTLQVINTSTGKVVNPASVNWKNGGKGYRLRQLPGKTNALGRVKFLFPNRHAIYLHDTPNRKLFKKSRRAFSSGCIRVEKADDLALFLLDDRGYDDARYKKESRRSKEKWINLKGSKRYPVFLDYYTAWADDNGKVRYESDIYGYDKPLIKAYKAALTR